MTTSSHIVLMCVLSESVPASVKFLLQRAAKLVYRWASREDDLDEETVFSLEDRTQPIVQEMGLVGDKTQTDTMNLVTFKHVRLWGHQDADRKIPCVDVLLRKDCLPILLMIQSLLLSYVGDKDVRMSIERTLDKFAVEIKEQLTFADNEERELARLAQERQQSEETKKCCQDRRDEEPFLKEPVEFSLENLMTRPFTEDQQDKNTDSEFISVSKVLDDLSLECEGLSMEDRWAGPKMDKLRERVSTLSEQLRKINRKHQKLSMKLGIVELDTDFVQRELDQEKEILNQPYLPVSELHGKGLLDRALEVADSGLRHHQEQVEK